MKLYEPACSLRKHTAQLESSMEKAETSFSKARKNAQVLAVLLPFVYLVRRTYKKEIPESGIKGYKKATTRVLRKDIERRELANTVRRILK